MEYCAAIISADKYAPMPMISDVVPPGPPTVDSAGPALPAEQTNVTPCSFTMSL